MENNYSKVKKPIAIVNKETEFGREYFFIPLPKDKLMIKASPRI